MLVETRNWEEALAQVAADPVRGFALRNMCHQWATGREGLHVLVDDERSPSVLVAHVGAEFGVLGEIDRYLEAMQDLVEGRVEQEGGWPDEAMRGEWEKHGAGRRAIFLNCCPRPVWRAALDAGFEPHPGDLGRHMAYLWVISGKPRFGEMVKHPCRLGEGSELLELMRQGIQYDPDGWYVGQCLKHGPSFVCELPVEGGEPLPVCWSCTHLNGTMGMIYTPEEHRRKGYARSLAAFQMDHMLQRDGVACAHVIENNIASMRLVKAFGGVRWEEPAVWRVIYWPGEAPPAEEEAPSEDEE